MSCADFEQLDASGLNLQAVFNLSELPDGISAAISKHVGEFAGYRQLILIGHGGRRMWEALQASAFTASADPVDSFSQDLVHRWFADRGNRYEMLYPGDEQVVPLQKLGALAGWHHSSPFRIGINAHWGSWFAYRAVVLADSDFEPTPPLTAPSPCDSCMEKPCIPACPADALTGSDASLQPCIDYRLTGDSRCKDRCFSRMACPVAVEHKHSMQQLNYHYGRSMQTIEDYYQ